MKKYDLLVLSVCGFLFSILLTGCPAYNSAARIIDPLPTATSVPTACVPGSLNFTTVYHSNSGINAVPAAVKRNVVINNQADYTAYCGAIFAAVNPIDFSSKTAILAEYGFTVTGCDSNEITGITTDCASITVNINESCCNACYMIVVNDNPAHLVTIEKSALPVNFVYLPNSCMCGGR